MAEICRFARKPIALIALKTPSPRLASYDGRSGHSEPADQRVCIEALGWISQARFRDRSQSNKEDGKEYLMGWQRLAWF